MNKLKVSVIKTNVSVIFKSIFHFESRIVEHEKITQLTSTVNNSISISLAFL